MREEDGRRGRGDADEGPEGEAELAGGEVLGEDLDFWSVVVRKIKRGLAGGGDYLEEGVDVGGEVLACNGMVLQSGEDG